MKIATPPANEKPVRKNKETAFQLGVGIWDHSVLCERDLSFQKPFSEATGELIDSEIRKLLAQAYQDAKTILGENRSLLEKLSALLLQKEVVDQEDLENTLGKHTADFKYFEVSDYEIYH